MPDEIAVLGSGGHAKVVIEAILARSPGCRIILLDDAAEAAGRTIFGIPVAGGRDRLDGHPDAAVALGIGDNLARSRVMQWLQQRGRRLETVIHPNAIVATSVSIGPGAFIGAGAITIAEARIGAGAIINTGASVDHDCEIGEAAHIAPGVRLCGSVSVGDRTLIGVGSAIRPGTKIADDVIVGAGSVVVADILSPGTYVGNPARPI
jgi:sugar O-acyltransferase (sialic acid O-acetyltransferase NeuD family)